MTVVTPFIEPRKQDDRLIRREYKMLIGGKSVDARSGERIERESPAYEGIVVSSVPKGSLEDSVAGIMAARKAFDEGPWPRMSGHERATILHRIGEAIGLTAAVALTRFMASMLFNVAPTDALTFGAVGGVLALVAMTASFVPARRAMRVNPATALRDS